MSDFFERSPGQRFATPPAGRTAPAGIPAPPAPDGQPGPQPPRKTVERYRTSHWWVAVLIGVVAVGLVAGMVWFGTRPAPVAGPSPSASTPAPPLHTPPPGGQGIEFDATRYNATGYWEILGYVWDNTGVTLTCRISVDTGTLSFTWMALDNTSADFYQASPISTLPSGTVSAGQSVTGTVRFDKNRNGTLIILADGRQSQITALSITA
jgi:hypothetical protein